ATLEPRKNLGTLVEAFALLGDTGLELCVAGGAGWGEQPQLDGSGVVRLGRVTDEQLARLYRGAAAVVYPSRFEGFGMPVTEAMASGAPVVASSHPSLDEASGDAAVRADPESADAIAAAILQARERRASLEALARGAGPRAKGFAPAAAFSWQRTGELFLGGYRRFAEASPRRRPGSPAPARRGPCRACSPPAGCPTARCRFPPRRACA